MSNEGTLKTFKHWWDIRALEGAKAVKIHQNAMLYCGAPSLYWPSGCDTDPKLWPYAVACLEVALSLSDVAVASYAKIVEAWELPGCQDIKDACLKHWPSTRTWLDKMIKAYADKGALPELPGLASTYAKYEHNADFNTLNLLAAQFVLLNFNREQDIVDETFKVIPGLQSFHLTKAIAVRSIIDYAEYDAARLHRYQHPDIERIMTAKPWPKYHTKEREIRHQITNTATSEGFKLIHDDKLLKDGERWYKCRVDPGDIEIYLNQLADEFEQIAPTISELPAKEQEKIKRQYFPDRSRIENDIAPCDEATGYPRKWRK